MKAQKKAERANQKALDWLAKMGKSTEEIKVEPVIIESNKFPKEHSLQMEAVLKYWDNPVDWIEKTCQRCNKIFATLYYPIGYCSDKCRLNQLRDIGFVYNPNPDSGYWGRVPQMTIPPEALIALKEAAQEAAQEIPTRPLDETLQSKNQSKDDSPKDLDFSLPELDSFL